MPAPLPLPVRRLILQRARRGDTAAAIARDLGLCPRTVRHLVRRLAARPDRLGPSYRPGPGPRPSDHPLYAQALALRQLHPSWGAGYLRLRLAADPALLPSERTLQRWLRGAGQPAAAGGRRPPAEASRAAAPHDTWQVDAAEQFRLAGGQGACWLRVVDEYSGAFLATTVFPPVLLGPRPRGGGAAGPAGRVRPLGAAAPAAGEIGRAHV